MEHDFELEDLKRKASIFGDDANLGMHYNAEVENKVFWLQVPSKKIYMGGLTYSELKFYLYGYSDATKEA